MTAPRAQQKRERIRSGAETSSRGHIKQPAAPSKGTSMPLSHQKFGQDDQNTEEPLLVLVLLHEHQHEEPRLCLLLARAQHQLVSVRLTMTRGRKGQKGSTEERNCCSTQPPGNATFAKRSVWSACAPRITCSVSSTSSHALSARSQLSTSANGVISTPCNITRDSGRSSFELSAAQEHMSSAAASGACCSSNACQVVPYVVLVVSCQSSRSCIGVRHPG